MCPIVGNLEMGKRLKCGEVFIWNCDPYTCAIECTLCEDRPYCNVEEFSEHIQVWHQDWDVELNKHDNKCEPLQKNDEIITLNLNECDKVEPFEEVLIVDGNLDSESVISVEEIKFQNDVDIDIESIKNEENIFDFDELVVNNQNSDSEIIKNSVSASKSSAFEERFQEWCRKQCAQTQTQTQTQTFEANSERAEDSGVEKSEYSSLTASPSQTISDDDFSFDFSEQNVKEQINFGLDESPKSRLTTAHMEKLIEIYKSHPRLWQQNHTDYNNKVLCRKSWQEITRTWNQCCLLNFSMQDIRLRISTLRQRYMKERKRRELNNEFCDIPVTPLKSHFSYFDNFQFLDDEQETPYTLRTSQLLKENSKLIEAFASYPLLWDKNNTSRKSVEEREQAYESICTALKTYGIHIPQRTVRLRIAGLKKRYRIEKLQHLQYRLKGKTFVTRFKHYEEMKYLDRHIAPFVCDICGKIFRIYEEYRNHIENEIHKDIKTKAAQNISQNMVEQKNNEMINASTLSEKENLIMDTEISNQQTLMTQANDKPAEEVLAFVQPIGTDWVNGQVPIYIMDGLVLANSSLTETTEETQNVDDSCLQPTLIVDEELIKTMQLIMNESVETECIKSVETLEVQNNINFINDSSAEYANLVNNLIENPDIDNETQNVTQNSDNNILSLNLILPIVQKDGDISTILPNYCHEQQPQQQQITNLVQNNLLQNDAVNINTPNELCWLDTSTTMVQNDTAHSEIIVNEDLYKEISNQSPHQFSWMSPCNIEETVYTNVNVDPVENINNEINMDFQQLGAMAAQFDSNDKSFTNTALLVDLVSNALMLENVNKDENNEVSAKAIQTISENLSKEAEIVEKMIETNMQGLDVKTSELKLKIKIPRARRSKRKKKQKAKDEPTEYSDDEKEDDAIITKVEEENNSKEVGDIESKKKKPSTLTRFSEPQTLKLIELFEFHTQLWDPQHPHFNSRRHKRVAWRTIAMHFNQTFYLSYNWLQLQRKMMDYVKYYKSERRRILRKGVQTKWTFYERLTFLEKIITNNSPLEKRVEQKKQTMKIIEIYREHPQLWNTEHMEYTKRIERNRSITSMCSRLQEVYSITIGAEKLKQCLLDLRYNYRAAKMARIEAEKRNETFEPTSLYEFFTDLQFLEPHVSPFKCVKCLMDFERFSDYSQHQKKEHKIYLRPQYWPKNSDKNSIENVCHICGIKFTLRHNLVQHLNRHYCERSLACSVCSKKFFTKSALTEHERTHTKIPAVICPECGQTFFNASKLNQHLKRHRNQRDFPCKQQQCDKAFYTAFELARHMRRHLNIRDKVCPVCSKTFVAGSSYYSHMKLHNSTKQYSCMACQLEFSQYAGLYKHRKKYHSDV